MRSLASRVATVALLLTLLSAVTFCAALHEDEQGKFDWTLRFLGDVHLTAVPKSEHPKYFYLASTQGAVGQVSLTSDNAGKLLKRQMVDSTPRCLVPTAKYLLVLTEDGSIEYLDRENLAAQRTVKLSVPRGQTITSAVCEGKDDEVDMFTIVNGVPMYFRINAKEEYFGTISAQSWNVAVEEATRILVGPKHILVNSKTSCHVFSRSAYENVKTVEGQCEDVTSTYFVVRDRRVSIRSFAVGDPNPQYTWTCDECQFHLVESSEKTPQYFQAYVLPKGLIVDFGSTRINIRGTQAGSKLIAVLPQANGFHVLVKTHVGNLMMVSHTGEILWERVEALGSPSAVIVVDQIGVQDHFHFSKEIIIATKSGAVYGIPVDAHGEGVRLVVDIHRELQEALEAPHITDVVTDSIREVSRGNLRITCHYQGRRADVVIDLLNHAAHVDILHSSVMAWSSEFKVSQDMLVHPPIEDGEERHVFTVNTTSGRLSGFSLKGDAATPTWSVQIPSPLVAYALPNPAHIVFRNNLRLYPNKTKDETVYEVRHRYPVDNIVAVAHYEKEEGTALTTLVVTAVDTVTGSIHGVARHQKVEGDVKMLIVENAILYYFLDAEKMRYCFGVWELFRVEEGSVVTKDSGVSPPSAVASFFEKNDAIFSSRASLPPVIKVQTLGVYGGPIAALGVTTSYHSVANKNVVLVFQTGRVALMELNRLLRSRPIFFKTETQEMINRRDMTQILIPPTLYATHRYRLAAPQHLAVSPTGLESSNHLVVAGLDLFYVRYSSGKAFDLLNSDFYKQPLAILLVVIFLIILICRFFVKRKALAASWS